MTILELARCILADSSSIQPQFTKLTFLCLWKFISNTRLAVFRCALRRLTGALAMHLYTTLLTVDLL